MTSPDTQQIPDAQTPAREAAKARLAEIHQYVRHTWQILVGWFSIFVTVNYASMGWLAGSSSMNDSLPLAAGLFVFQNLLGIAAEFVVLANLRRAVARSLVEEGLAAGGGPAPRATSPIPMGVYTSGVYLMVAALMSILVGWIVLAIITR